MSISVDTVGQNAAMVAKLDLPFPLLADPDRSAAIEPFDVVDPVDERNLSLPALILVEPGGSEAFRFVSRDYADRLPEDEVLERVRELGLSATTQRPPKAGTEEAGPRAIRLEDLPIYFRGARFAVLAFGRRHKDLGDELKEDSKAFVDELDRYWKEVRELRDRLRG